MSIRMMAVTAPSDSHGTQVTFTEGQVLDIEPGGTWEALIGAANCPVMSPAALAAVQTGSGTGTSN